ncbi:MAG: hypothetical protein IKM41_04865, partial [Tidjanibacter sp.]|nr:hypothetical protein [Tidjanibacter sp.]
FASLTTNIQICAEVSSTTLSNFSLFLCEEYQFCAKLFSFCATIRPRHPFVATFAPNEALLIGQNYLNL